MKLHLGCGSKILEGFINVDARPFDSVITDDVTTLSLFKSGSTDLIYACHVLEHICRHEINNVLKRWFEILKPGGTLRVAVPDFDQVVHLYKNNVPIEDLIGFLYGGQDYDFNFHRYCWNFESLEKDLKNAGFFSVRRYEWRETEHADIDDYSQSYHPHMEKDSGILMSLNVEATKAVLTTGSGENDGCMSG